MVTQVVESYYHESIDLHMNWLALLGAVISYNSPDMIMAKLGLISRHGRNNRGEETTDPYIRARADEVIALRGEGLTYKQIGRQLQMPHETAFRICKRAGLTGPRGEQP